MKNRMNTTYWAIKPFSTQFKLLELKFEVGFQIVSREFSNLPNFRNVRKPICA